MIRRHVESGADVRPKQEVKLGDVLKHVTPQDLIRSGMIPELIGRLPIIATLDDLMAFLAGRPALAGEAGAIAEYRARYGVTGTQGTGGRNGRPTD